MKNSFARLERPLNQKEFELFFDAYAENNRLLWEEYRKGNVLKKELVKLRFQKTFDELQVTGIDPFEMNDVYLDELPRQKQLVAGAVSVLEYLKSRGCELFIITNGFTQVQHKKLESAGIRRYFNKVFISEEIMAPKPALEIFEYSLKSANAPKARSLMIGDDFESDIRGALNFGIDAVYLNPQENGNPVHENASFPAGRQFYRIASLAGLSTII